MFSKKYSLIAGNPLEFNLPTDNGDMCQGKLNKL